MGLDGSPITDGRAHDNTEFNVNGPSPRLHKGVNLRDGRVWNELEKHKGRLPFKINFASHL